MKKLSTFMIASLMTVLFAGCTHLTEQQPIKVNELLNQQDNIQVDIVNVNEHKSLGSNVSKKNTIPYLKELMDWENSLDLNCMLSRDDKGFKFKPYRTSVALFAECIQEMNLVPYEKSEKRIDVPYPFTLTFHINGKEETISVNKQKISIGEYDYFPTNTKPLSKFFEDDHKRFLTSDIFLLKEKMPFTSSDVSEICLEEHENYSDNINKVFTKNPLEINKITQALSNTVVREFEEDDQPFAFSRVGGNLYFCRIVLKDGTEWSINPNGMSTIKSSKGEEIVLELSSNYDDIFELLDLHDDIPTLQAQINNISPTVYNQSYHLKGCKKQMTHIISPKMLFDSDSVLLPKDTYKCNLKWSDKIGENVVPKAIIANLYKPTGEYIEVDEGIPLKVDGTTLTLPGNEGKYFVKVRAEFTDDKWGEYIFSYRTSIYPTLFYDISFGNDDGGVTFTRSDLNVQATGTQNRKYVNFIFNLELSPFNEKKQKLPVKKPFTMTFTCEDKLYKFDFSKNGVKYNGQLYKVKNPEIIKSLYDTYDEEGANMRDKINYDLRGFLTKDVAYFTKKFKFRPDEIKEFIVNKENPKQLIRYNLSNISLKEKEEILNYVVMGKNWGAKDFYTLRRFYLSYKIVLKDGTTYEIGEKILKNGKDTGWYTIQSDYPLASELIKTMDGVTENRAVSLNNRKTQYPF